MNRTIKQNEYQTLPTHITYYYSDINNKTRLTSYSIDGVTFTITYDINGNPLEYYNYDVEFENGKLISLKENNQIKLRFTYDSNGKRTKKEIYNEETNTYDSVEYIYVGELLIGEKQDNQMIEYIYDEQNLVGFQITTGSVIETYYYVKNLQKDITKIIDETGKEVVSYIYDAYGNIVSTKGSKKDTIGKINPYRYRGYYYDIETGLFFCNSRYYNPEWGRFIQPDDIEYLDPESINGLNLYAYCNNDPINMYDPSGHFAISALIIGAIIGGVIGAASSAVSQGLTKGWDEINGWQVLLDGTIGAISGALGASGISQVVSMAAGGILGAAGSIGGDLITSGGDWSQVNVGKAILMGAIGVGLGRWTGAGTQNSKAMVSAINKGTSWGSKAFLTSAKEAALRPNSGLTIQTMYMNMSKAISLYTVQGISKVSLATFGSTMFGNMIGW